jgi:alkylmercury lyase
MSASLPDVELDDHGRIVGYGLTLRETPYRVEVDGKRLHTWCALDTLVFPTLLGRSARIYSSRHGTGTPIRITVEPTGVTSVDPETAVVSIVGPVEQSSVRSAFCGSSGTNVGERAGMTCGFSLLVNGVGVGGEGG